MMDQAQNSNYTRLIARLDEFIRKFYLNKLTRGLLISAALLLAWFLVINLLESQFYFSKSVRKVLFYSFLISGLSIIATMVLWPLLQFVRLGKIISHKKAASIIGSHFSNVNDKLINILQLKESSETSSSRALIDASIDQKINDIKLIPFTNAVDLSKNKKYLKYLLPPFLALFALLIAAPNMIRDSSKRLVQNNIDFEREAPFHFNIDESKLKAIQYDDFNLDVKVEGEKLPADAFIVIKNFPYKLKKNNATEYSHVFSKLQESVDFYFEGGGFQSKLYKLEVIPKPGILNFSASLDYPAYLGLKDEMSANIGDISVPQGTQITWQFETQNTDEIIVRFGDNNKVKAEQKDEQLFAYTKKMMQDELYALYVNNIELGKSDSIQYRVSVKPDLFPTINVSEIIDTSEKKLVVFTGDASDDYGIKDLIFHYQVQSVNETNGIASQNYIHKALGKAATKFTHLFDLRELQVKPGDRVNYYFEVWDNDGVNGSKSTKSQLMTYKLPSIKEMEDNADEMSKEIKEELKATIKDAKDLEEELKKMQEKLIDKKELSWEDKEKLEKMLQKHKKMEQSIANIQEKNKQNNQNQEEFKQFSEEIQEKKDKLQKMMDELLSEEMKEMLKKFEEMMEQMKDKEMFEKMEELKMNDEDMKKELDRMLELMKQLEFEQKMEETIDKLNELAEKQDSLGDKTDENESGKLEEEKQKQEELTEEFKDIKEDMKELDKMNEELNDKKDMLEEEEKQGEEVEQEQKDSMKDMEQKDNNAAAKKQKKAAKKMKDMASSMQAKMGEMKEEQQEEDLKAIRQLLENLITLSKDQERLMDDFSSTTVNNPNFLPLVQNQHKINDDFQIVQDSLVALSKRVFEIEAFVVKELGQIDKNMGDALNHLEERRIPQASANQQYVMTSLNNLALMLSESMDQMQQQMQQDGPPGSGSCDKPGGKGKGKPKKGMKDLQKMQEELNKKLEEMLGKSDGGKKPGSKPSDKGMSKEFAQTAAQQAAIKEALKKMQKEKGKNGQKDGGEMDQMIKEMEQTEKDLVNKQLTAEMLARQKQIMSKMLEAEKAEREQDQDNKRESQSGKDLARNIPPALADYLRKRQAEVEMYKTAPADLKPYYKSLVEKYLKSMP